MDSDQPADDVRRPPAAPSVLDAARFSVPQLPAHRIHRVRVAQKLERSSGVPLVLVSAPAGTGKTSAVVAWIRSCGEDVGWISFERDDHGFWEHVLRCLAGCGVSVPTGWHVHGQTLLGRQRLMSLCSLVADRKRRLVLVLEDYELESRELGDELDFLLRHCGGRLKLVLVGRVDPVFPLYRYALTDGLVEIRLADLALTDEEAAELLRSDGVVLSEGSVRVLNRRLGGWAAGVHLAARALAGRAEEDDNEAFVDSLVRQTVVLDEFLVSEVLDQLRGGLRQVLLDTSVPDVLCSELVEDIAGPAASHALSSFSELRSLVEPESGQPGWFRYPTFARDLLRARLAYEDPERLVEVHRATARWLAREGLVTESLAHLAEVHAWDEVVVDVVRGLRVGRLLLEGRDGALTAVARRVPVELDDAAACLVRGAVALAGRDAQRCRVELDRVGQSPAGADVGATSVRLSLAVVEGLLASRSGDAVAATELAGAAERGLTEGLGDASPPGPSELYTVTVVSKAFAALRRGDLVSAVEGLELAVDHAPASMGSDFRADCLAHHAIAEAMSGNLTRAVRVAEEALSCASAGGLLPSDPPVLAAQAALAGVAVDRDEIDSAKALLAAARASGTVVTDSVVRAVLVQAEAGIESSEGRPVHARTQLEEAAAGLTPRDAWLADHLRVRAARVSLVEGELEDAAAILGSVRDGGGHQGAVTAFLLEAEKGVLAQTSGLTSLAHDDGVPRCAQVEALLLEGYLFAQQRSVGKARAAVDGALRAARPERLRSPFRDVGPAVRQWMGKDPYFLRAGSWLDHESVERMQAPVAPAVAIAVEPLTAKELEVLELLSELLSTDEIAAKMFVSVNTVKTHVRSVLRKLGVSRRNAAIRRARELGILDR